MSRSRLVALGAVLLALALTVYLGFQARSADRAADARADALSAAKTRVPALLTYHSDSLDNDLDHALQQTTGAFTRDYRKVLTDVVRPTAEQRGISTTASVSAAGVVSGDDHVVVVLVFLTQTTTAKGDHSAVTGSRVEVTLRPSPQGWKIAGLRPV